MKKWNELSINEQLQNGGFEVLIGIGVLVITIICPFFLNTINNGLVFGLAILSLWFFMQAEIAKQNYKISYEIQKNK